jgi:hypothetical protein
MQDPELVNQLKERLPEALFEKLNDSLSIDRDRLSAYRFNADLFAFFDYRQSLFLIISTATLGHENKL